MLVVYGSYIIRQKNKCKKGKYLSYALAVNACLLVFDSLSYVFRGDVSTLGFIMTRVCNFMVFTLEFVLTIIAVEYFYDALIRHGVKKPRTFVNAVHGICALAIVLIIISQFTNWYYYFDETNHYHRNGGWYFNTLLVIVLYSIFTYMILKNRKRFKKSEIYAMLSYIALPMFALVIQALFYGLSLVCIGITVALLIMYITNELERIREYARQTIELANKRAESEHHKKKIIENQTNLLIGQMQPHFVYNCLAVIRSLCRENPDIAVDAIDHFTSYLRISLDIMDGTQLVMFSQENKLIDDYLYLEKLRFGEKIKIVKNIEIDDFMVPPLAIQTLVENAVKHGIRGKNSMGTLTIITKEKESYNEILIIDDGVGFDVAQNKNDGLHHIGLKNAKERLSMQLNASMDVESSIGNGTRIIIRIPRRREVIG